MSKSIYEIRRALSAALTENEDKEPYWGFEELVDAIKAALIDLEAADNERTD